MRWTWPVVLLVAVFCSNRLMAQGFAGSDNFSPQHRDFGGKACLETSGLSRPLASNPKILNHSVVLDNHCVDRIKAKVCYYGTDDCTDVEVPGKSRKEQVIGVFPAMQMFRYAVKEQF